jgi:hypothetical protein
MLFIDNKYTRWYFGIITKAQVNITQTQYTEKHHIVPESFFINRTRRGPKGWIDGNPEENSNIVSLTPREHFVCHWLLTKMTTGSAKAKMINAMFSMKAVNGNNPRYDTEITSRVYESLRGKRKLTDEQREKLKSRVVTDETRQKLREKRAGKQPNLGKTQSEYCKKKSSEQHTGKIISDDTKMKMSLAAKGKPKSPEHIQKLRAAAIARHANRSNT